MTLAVGGTLNTHTQPLDYQQTTLRGNELRKIFILTSGGFPRCCVRTIMLIMVSGLLLSYNNIQKIQLIIGQPFEYEISV